MGSTPVEIEAVRLDKFVDSLSPVPESIALWIDVEGAAYEVLKGVSGIKNRIDLIHVEVETREYWQGQKLKGDVVTLARSLGYEILARGRTDEQHDLVLVSRRVLSAHPRLVPFIVAAARLLTLDLKTVPLVRQFVRG
jgi:hypothetical protein